VTQTFVTDKQPESATAPLSADSEPRATVPRSGLVEGWLQLHLDTVAAALVAAGFVIRLAVSNKSFLNPDEALHYLLLDQPSLFLAYRANLTNAHPPLFSSLLYFWHFLGHSELMLRLPSVFAGTAFCWLLYKWTELSFSKAAALIVLLLATFSPTLIGLSAEMREYSLLLFFMALALYFLELAIREKSARGMVYFTLALYLAILTHYSAVFFVLALGLYGLVRIADTPLPRKSLAVWLIGQIGTVAVYGILYVTHVSKVSSSIPQWSSIYTRYNFHGAFADIFPFLREHTPTIFQYLFGEAHLAQIMLLLWIASIALLFARALLPGRGYPRSSQLAILLLLPFMGLWGAVVAGKYPYSPSRHIIFLAPFIIVAIGALLASILGQKLWRVSLLAILLVSVSVIFGDSSEASQTIDDKGRASMAAALNYVRSSIPANDLILLDTQTSLTLAYYLCAPGEIHEFYASQAQFVPLSCGGRSFITLSNKWWDLNPRNLPRVFQDLVRQYALKPGTQVWVVQTNWAVNLDAELPLQYPQLRCLVSKRSGKGIVIIPFTTTLEALPACGLI
jgi:hypothetical protein